MSRRPASTAEPEVDPLRYQQRQERRLLLRLCERAGLNPEQRACVELYNDRLSIRAVAGRLGMSKDQVHRRLQNAWILMSEAAKEMAAERQDERAYDPTDDWGPANHKPQTPVFAENEYTGEMERVRLRPKSII